MTEGIWQELVKEKERKAVTMEALNTYKAEKTLAEQMNERLAELKMTKAEAALKMNYSRAALSQYLNGKYASDPTELEKKVREFLEASGGVDGSQGQEGLKAGAGILKKKVEFFESRDFVQTIGVSDGELREKQTANYFSDIYPIDCAVLSANAQSCPKCCTLLPVLLSA